MEANLKERGKINMSQYGIKINNYEAGSIYDVNLGVREFYDTTPAMLTNSLFKDYITENGLSVRNGFTRDIICIQFHYGSVTYDEEIKRIKKSAKINRMNLKKSRGNKKQHEKYLYTKQKLMQRYQNAEKNKDIFCRKTVDELRTMFYTDGVEIKYPKFDRSGNIKGYQTVQYKRLYRTPGKAKKGSCMFIKSSLYKKAYNFLTMGYKLPKKNAPIVEMGAYAPLSTSTIEDRIHINPRNILIMDDVDSFFTTDVISIETDKDNHCCVKKYSNYQVKNTMFDGQALIDTSIFPSWGNGYILLRQHFFKAAAFHANIQQFFKDYYGDKYDVATVKDIFGNDHYVKDIKLITTTNACKWTKFNITYDYWCEKVEANGSLFGIVKTAHPSKLGDKQRMSYQMVNTLTNDIMDNVLHDSVEYIDALKNDDETFFEYLDRSKTFSNDYEVLLALCKHNPDFVKCDYFRDRRTRIISGYVANIREGHLIQNAENLTIVGSPYAMLMHSVGEDCLNDPTFDVVPGEIQCYTERFDMDEYLAFFRSPHNCQSNICYLHNHYHPFFEKYFKFGKQIVAINMNHTDIQDRGNGLDEDGDAGYVTNQPDIVQHAKYCYENHHTIVNNIPQEKTKYDNTMEDYARVDNKLSASQRNIGESSNTAQLCLTYAHSMQSQEYQDYACIMSVVAQIEIDGTKRLYAVSGKDEIKKIKDHLNVDKNGYPFFWTTVNPNVNRKKINKSLSCPMDSASKLRVKSKPASSDTVSIKEFFIQHPNNETRKNSRRIQKLIDDFLPELLEFNINKKNDDEDYFLLRSDYEDMIENIRKITLPNKYVGIISYLINRGFLISRGMKSTKNMMQIKLNKNKSLLMKTLYDVNHEAFLQCFCKELPKNDTT